MHTGLQNTLNPHDQLKRLVHDICSPIAVIEMTLYRIVQTNAVSDLDMVRLALGRMRDILNSARQSGLAAQIQLLGINNLLEEVVALKRYEWLRKSCTLNLYFSAGTENIAVYCIPSEFKRMLSNLLNNALEAATGHVKINVGVSHTDDGLKINISDNGHGILESKIQDCIDGASTKHVGRGLGLSFAKEYMEQIGGSLSIRSVFNVGTVVGLTFCGKNRVMQ